MKKILGASILLISLSSCQLATDTVETLKNNIKESISLPNILPSMEKTSNSKEIEGKLKDSISYFSLSTFVEDKLGL